MILYIDDKRQLPAGFVEDLRAEGFQLVHVDDPETASRLVRVDEPDLVLMEVVLSSCDGLALLEEIRSYGGWPAQVPIVVLTRGERSPELYGRALELDVKEFLTKPALKAQLLKSVLEYAGQTPEPEATLAGDLSELPVPEILYRLRQDAATGVLILTHRKTRRAIQLRNGSPVAVGSSGGFEAPEDFLARRKRITEKQRRAVKEQTNSGAGRPVEILVGMGALSEQALDAAMLQQAEEQLLETFRWASGPFGYFPEKSVKPDTALAIDRNPAELILEGILRGSPAKSVSEALRKRASLYVSREPKPPYEFGEFRLASAQRVFLVHMNGDRSVREVLEAGELDERTLYGLFIAGFLGFHRDPVMMLLDEVGAARKHTKHTSRRVVRRASKRPAMPTASFLEPSPPAAEPSAPLLEPSPLAPAPSPPAAERTRAIAVVAPAREDPESVRIEAALSDLCERIAAQDDFGVLGVTEQSSDEEVRAAHERLLGAVPFDEVPAKAPRLADLAAQARERIDLAFAHLADGDARRAYATLRREDEQAREKKDAASRAFEAESWFRKGEVFLGAKKYEQAVEAFGMSAHLDPKEGEYTSHLGYSLYLSNPREPIVVREALEHIAKGIKLSPNRETSYVYLGRIFRANDAPDRARKMFERAVRIKPDCHAALQELRILSLREQKSRGLLQRLLKK